MKQENQVTPSPTNTAARESIETLLTQVFFDAYHSGHHDTVEGGYTDVFHSDRETYWREHIDLNYADDIATLTQQQGGEQEARELLDIEVMRALFDSLPISRARDAYAAVKTYIDLCNENALRSKQPAASEGDERREYDAFAGAINVLLSHGIATSKAVEIARDLSDNTSEQAAGEAVAMSDSEEAAYLAKRGFYDGPSTLSADIAALTTPPRHPADEGRDALCIHCGRPTMHIGNVCFTCSKAAKNALQAGTP